MSRPKSTRLLRPTREELLAAAGTKMPDVIAPGLQVLFCGINPSVYSAVVRHHFARPGNRFWPALYASGFTPRLLLPSEQGELLALGCGITNVVEEASVSADTLTAAEYAEGGRRLEAKVRRYHPRYLAVLGIGAWRSAFQKPKARLGLQPEPLGGARVWVLPNPSGLNAHYLPQDLARLFRALRLAVESEGREG